MPNIHLPYGGSTITRTINCPPWRHHADRLPVCGSSEYADRGTRLHEVMERVYSDPLDAAEVLAREKSGLSEDDAEAVQIAFDAAELQLDLLDADQLLIEPFVRLAGHDDAGGSLDLGAVSADGETVLILDYKFGHMQVDDHQQLGFYALCLMDTHTDLFDRAERVITAIVQPASETPLRTQTWSLEDLAEFRLTVERALNRSRASGASVSTHAGDWCKFCPAAAICPSKRKAVNAFLQHDPAALAELGAAMDLVAEVKEQLKAVEAAAFAQLEAGNPVPGWKLVEKQKRRYWVDEAAVRHRLRYSKSVRKEQYVEETLRSPAQVEKATKGAVDLSDLIESRASGNTIAPESDKRPAVHTPGNVPAALAAAMSKTD